MKQVSRILLLLAAIAVVAFPAAAQESGDTTEGGAPAGDGEGGGEGAGGGENAGGGNENAGGGNESASENKGGDILEDAGPDIPTSEYAPEAERMLGEMRNDLSKALDALANARNAKDAVKLNYINEQITTMKGILRISEDAYIDLQEALASGALEKARYEFGKIRMSHRKMKELSATVQNAKGAEASYTGGTEVTSEVDQAQAGGNAYYGNQDNQFTDSRREVVDGTNGAGGDSGGSGTGGGDSDGRPQPVSDA